MERVRKIEEMIGMDLIDYCSKIFEEERKIKRKSMSIPRRFIRRLCKWKIRTKFIII